MSSCMGGLVIILSCLLGPTAGATGGGETGKKPGEASDRELMDLIRKTQELAEQSQAELKRSREQNENLQQLLEQTRQEIFRLREEMNLLHPGMVASRSNAIPIPEAGNKSRSTGSDTEQASKPVSTEASLAGRIDRVEDQVEINTTQIKEHEQTKVGSDSRFKVRLFGTILTNTYINTADGSAEAVPTAAPTKSEQAEYGGPNLGATLRQTQFGFAMTGPKVGGARLSADVDFDFFGGDGAAYGGNVLGALRMRTGSARLDGSRTSLAVGLMTPMISPLNPRSLAALYYPALGDSGNLWQWRPQVVVERRIPVGEGTDFIVQGGLMMPFGDRIGEKVLEGGPGYESRIAWARRLDNERQLMLGVGGYFYSQRFGVGRKVDSYAATGDWVIPLNHRLELSGEAFYGRSIGLSRQSGEDIADLFTFSGPLDDPSSTIRGIYSLGGWTQLSARATPRLEFNLACGLDDPRNRDIFAGRLANQTRLRNQTLSANSIFRLRSNFLLSLEYRQMWTAYRDARTSAGHLNMAVGYTF